MPAADPTPNAVLALPDFAALRAAAPRLAEPAQGEIFYTLDWFEVLLNTGIAPASPLLLLTQTANASPICLPLVDGPQIGGLSNFYSALFGPIASGEVDPAACAALAAQLRNDERCWPVIRLQPLDAEGAFLREFSGALRAVGYDVDTFHCFANWTLLLAGRDYASYLAYLPSRLQNTLRRARRKLEKAGDFALEVHRLPGRALDAAVAEFESIYAASWKEPEPFPNFIGSLCRRAAERGWLRLGVLRLDGEALAAQLWLVKDGKASIFKLAYREGKQAYSPGSVLTAELMRYVIDEDKVREVDFLSGDDAYKQDWMSHRRERVGLVAFRLDRWEGWTAAFRHRLGKWRRRLMGGV